jgi:hypothetical protein
MTPQEHLAEAESHLRQASAWEGHPSPSDAHQVQLAIAHVQAGQLAQQLITWKFMVKEAGDEL